MILLGIICLVVGYVWVRPLILVGWVLFVLGLIFLVSGNTLY